MTDILAEQTNQKFNTIYAYLTKYKQYDNYKIVNRELDYF